MHSGIAKAESIQVNIRISATAQSAIVIMVSTAVYCFNRYHQPFAERTWSYVFYLCILPGIVALMLRPQFSAWGLGWGRWRWTVRTIVVGAPLVLIFFLLAAHIPEVQVYYRPLRPRPEQYMLWFGFLAIEIFAWEFFWRSFMLLGLEPSFGKLSMFVQMMPYAIAHITKPEIEVFGSMIGGILAGYAVLKCRSIWPVYILHLLLDRGIHFV